MPERDNDRLESFFKKVSGRPDIPFNEEDWKKLEARLDAKETPSSFSRRNRNRIAGATVVAVLLTGGLYWLFQTDVTPPAEVASEIKESSATTSMAGDATETLSPSQTEMEAKEEINELIGAQPDESESSKRDNSQQLEDVVASSNSLLEASDSFYKEEKGIAQSSVVGQSGLANEATQINIDEQMAQRVTDASTPLVVAPILDEGNDIQVNETKISPAVADKTKQKANLADSVVKEKNDVKVKDAYGSGLTEHPASPRLSLLLSIAPDFSTVAFDYYTDPGRAIGLTFHYHVKRSWSFSTGAVLSRKKYVGDGEDYTPPSGYWKSNTNGIIPETIDGTCNVLEIPIMVQYTILNKGKNRLLVGAGASSYIMLDEAYKYNFEYPNPGAKQGWSTDNKSALFFNVINVTAGFERRIFPGFMMGIEPYLKIPLEGIGWSDMKLYSAGASLTMRYIILKQKNQSTAF
jgi:hypothetical protein